MAANLGRWCGNCKSWVVMAERVCPRCKLRLGAPEVMPPSANPISKASKEPPRSYVLLEDEGALPPPDPGAPQLLDDVAPLVPPTSTPAPAPPRATGPDGRPLTALERLELARRQNLPEGVAPRLSDAGQPPPIDPAAELPPPPVGSPPPPPAGGRDTLPPPPGGGAPLVPDVVPRDIVPRDPGAVAPVPPSPSGRPGRSDGFQTWDPNTYLAPIPGVDDQPPPPASGVPEPPASDGPNTKQVALIIGGAILLFVIGTVILGALGGGDDEEPQATPTTIDRGPRDAEPFVPPEFPSDDNLPAEPPEVSPDEWDPLVRDLIPFIEETRNLRFKEPVEIEAAPTAELVEKYGTGGFDTDLAQEELDFILGVYRGLGIYEGGADVNALLARDDENLAIGFYDIVEERITVSTDVGGEGPAADAFRRTVLVHELTHALQHQHFNLSLSYGSITDLNMQRMMVEGDAVRVETAYVNSLPEEERAGALQLMTDLRSPTELGVLEVLGVEGEFIYNGGHQVTRLARILDSTEAVDLLVQFPPDREAQLLRVSSLFLHGQEPWAGSAPQPEYPVPDDAFPLGGGSFGAWIWYVAMATRIDQSDALRAADAIAADRFVLYERDGGVCGSYELTSASAADAGILAEGVQAWATTLPHGASVELDGQKIVVEACDPGTGAPMNFVRPPQDIVDGPIARTRAIGDVLAPQQGWWLDDELKERERWCLVETVQRAVSVDEALGGLSQERIDELGEAAVRACLPERAPDPGRPAVDECSAKGLEFTAEQEGLPKEVQATRTAILEAATTCDIGALEALFASTDPYFGDTRLPEPETAFDLVDRWQRREAEGFPVLADLVTALESGWMCGPAVAEAIPEATGEACAWVSPDKDVVDRRALTVVIGSKGGWRGFGDAPAVHDELMALWSESKTGKREADAYTYGGPGDRIAGLPPGWPLGVAPAALLEAD